MLATLAGQSGIAILNWLSGHELNRNVFLSNPRDVIALNSHGIAGFVPSSWETSGKQNIENINTRLATTKAQPSETMRWASPLLSHSPHP